MASDGRAVLERASVHQCLGPRAPPRRRCRISPPDAHGWSEVLPRQPEEPQPPREHAPKAPRQRCIPDALRDWCLNCLSYSHRIATCCLPLRCLRCHEFRRLARDCRRSRTPEEVWGGPAPGNQWRFIKAHARLSSPNTPEGSQARGATLPSFMLAGDAVVATTAGREEASSANNLCFMRIGRRPNSPGTLPGS